MNPKITATLRGDSALGGYTDSHSQFWVCRQGVKTVLITRLVNAETRKIELSITLKPGVNRRRLVCTCPAAAPNTSYAPEWHGRFGLVLSPRKGYDISIPKRAARTLWDRLDKVFGRSVCNQLLQTGKLVLYLSAKVDGKQVEVPGTKPAAKVIPAKQPWLTSVTLKYSNEAGVFFLGQKRGDNGARLCLEGFSRALFGNTNSEVQADTTVLVSTRKRTGQGWRCLNFGWSGYVEGNTGCYVTDDGDLCESLSASPASWIYRKLSRAFGNKVAAKMKDREGLNLYLKPVS